MFLKCLWEMREAWNQKSYVRIKSSFKILLVALGFGTLGKEKDYKEKNKKTGRDLRENSKSNYSFRMVDLPTIIHFSLIFIC